VVGRSGRSRPRRPLAGLRPPLRPGAHAALPQADARLDAPTPALAPDGRSLELAAGGGAVAIMAGARSGPRSAAALGARAAGILESGAGAPRHGRTFAPLGHPGPSPATSRKVAGTPDRARTRTGSTLCGAAARAATRRLARFVGPSMLHSDPPPRAGSPQFVQTQVRMTQSWHDASAALEVSCQLLLDDLPLRW
jgi:hypothetical protein